MESVLVVFNKKNRGLPPRLTSALAGKQEILVRDSNPESEKTKQVKITVEKTVVEKAVYGVPGDAARSRDVKERLQKMIDSGVNRLQVGELAEGDDPAFGVVKTLKADCMAGDKKFNIKGTDRQTVSLRGSSIPALNDLASIAAGRHYVESPVEDNTFNGICDIPAGVDLKNARVCLELDELTPEAAANISVNGVYAGGFICKPFRLDVTKHLKPGENKIKIVPFAPKSAKMVIY